MAVIDLDPRLPDGAVEIRNSAKIDFIILNIKKNSMYFNLIPLHCS